MLAFMSVYYMALGVYSTRSVLIKCSNSTAIICFDFYTFMIHANVRLHMISYLFRFTLVRESFVCVRFYGPVDS